MSIPTSTYRIQFRNGMTFDRAVELVPYMKRLGISHLYASPIFTAAPDSTHGYDVADANEIDPELGGREGFERLSTALRGAGLGLILDIVPNHMAAGLENRWWRSIIEWGRDSRYARFFDVNWTKRLTLPFLGDDFAKVLADGDLTLVFDRKAGCLALGYFDSHYPLAPSTYAQAMDGVDLPLADEIRALAAKADPEREEDFHEAIRGLADGPDADRLDAALVEQAKDHRKLQALHEAQPFRLISWRDAPRDLTYRRFFEITGLAGLRVEDQAVFEASHGLILDLVKEGKVDGLRVDHVDGLSDPGAYLDRLRLAVGPDCYLIVEKILADGEHLPSRWPISGTTGYEFIAALSDVLLAPEAVETFNRHYADVTGKPVDFEAEMRAAKGLMADVNFEGEGLRLLELACEIAASHAEARDLSEEDLAKALRELLIAFPIYRTYGNEIGLELADRQRLTDVMDEVRRGPNPPKPEALTFLGRILIGDVNQASDAGARMFRTRFQQLTGPLMAKSIEDTLFYRLNPLIALNEVGSEPHGRSFSLDAFHAEMKGRQDSQPAGLSATSTHDTKRGEDARARLYALSEAPDLWRAALDDWRRMNRPAVVSLNDGDAPEPAVEWLIYQALIGVWPDDLGPDDGQGLKALEERFLPYLEKSLREAKLRTSWNEQNQGYEKAVTAYARHLFSPEAAEFRRDFVSRLDALFLAGAVNSLTQTLIKLTAPGIPDMYQGSESLDLSLVDPDNRRMPDFARLTAGLDESAETSDPALWLDGRLKQQVIARILPLRREQPELFRKGDYVPLTVRGKAADHIVAFGRRLHDKRVVVIAPRLMLGAIQDATGLPDASFWAGTTIALDEAFGGGGYRDLMSGNPVEAGAELKLEDLLQQAPFSVLVKN
ncbi:malto-oligosyltrehalose synthase [Rhizobium sp. SL86]|uniref:malto-oligosyltrehalose synthase n=1 Tax=Rhizobium sp. SL86 TaxID=2995148 RepID=UPI00227550DC|nr:malto-oligosyltrehalose synthase [Rhizobium sp. SL86]MCY1667927.1 malto-oligosyltrehalose synthase [Rhizobium sp. SL86]